MYLWRAVDDESEVLDVVVQRSRDAEAALRLLKRLLRNQAVQPEAIVTEVLASRSAALDRLGLRHLHRPGVCGRTTAQRTRTCRSDGESGRCSSSRARPTPSASSPHTQQSTTPSTSSGISSAERSFGASAPKP